MLVVLIFFQLNFGSSNLFFLLNIHFNPYQETFLWLGSLSLLW